MIYPLRLLFRAVPFGYSPFSGGFSLRLQMKGCKRHTQKTCSSHLADVGDLTHVSMLLRRGAMLEALLADNGFWERKRHGRRQLQAFF